MDRTHSHVFCSCDLDLDFDPMTLIYELDLKFVKTYLHTKTEFPRSSLSKVYIVALRTLRER